MPRYFSVKEAVFPFVKFPEADPILGPEMKSTGEVMGTGRTFGEAYAKAQAASGRHPAAPGRGLHQRARPRQGPRRWDWRGSSSSAASRSWPPRAPRARCSEAGVDCRRVNKVREGRPHIVDMIKNDEIDLIVNTTEGKQAIRESNSIRREAVHRRVTYYTTLAAGLATCEALDHLDEVEVNRLQDLHARRGAHEHKRTPMTLRGAEALREELKRLKSEDAAERHQGDRRGARPRRPVGERRVPRRARAAGLHRGPHPGDRGQARRPPRSSSRDQAAQHRQGDLRRRWWSWRTRTTAHEVTYQIVGEDEADIRAGRISITSPIARALVGKAKGDVVDVVAPAGTRSYEILAIRVE